MSFSKIIEESFVFIAKEFSKLEHSKLSRSFEDRKGKPVKTPKEYKCGICVEFHGAEDIIINHIDGGNCTLITIKESSSKNTTVAYQIVITHSGKAFIRSSDTEEKWGPWKRVITADEPALKMIHAINDSVNKKSTLEIKGNVLIEDLVREDLLESENLESLRPLVSNEHGHVFCLPYERNKNEDHFIIPILRSGRRTIKNGKRTVITNLFDPSNEYYRYVGKHLIEIKLLFNYTTGQGAAIIYYINDKLHHIHELGDVNKSAQKSDEFLHFEKHKLNLEIIKSDKDKNERHIVMEYSGDNIINIRYFITRYSTN